MTITTKILSEIRRLNMEEKLNDAEISQELGIPYGTVRYYRLKECLPSRKHKYRDSLYKRYCVYDAHTSAFIIEGTAAECADMLGMQVGSFYSLVTKTRRGKSENYEIHILGKGYSAQQPD